MDSTENLSPGILLRHILRTEPLRTPVTRSVSKEQRRTLTRSTRTRAKDGPARTPQDIMRRKMRESISRKSLPRTKRSASARLKTAITPASSSMSFDEADTPRHLLRKILQTEPTKSPVVHHEAAPMKPQPPAADSSIANEHPSVELSGLDLPNLTSDMAASQEKGLKRKRPRRSFSVTAFEERLNHNDDAEKESDKSTRGDFSLSLSNSSLLSLKTPFVNDQSERKGLRRRASSRQRITEHKFADAVNKMHLDHGASSSMQGQPGLGETITLGPSEVGDLEVGADIIHCNTALYAMPDATAAPDLAAVATQDKSTVLASQIQRVSEQDGQKELDAGSQLPEVSESQARRATANYEDQAAVSQSEGEAAGLEPEEGEVEGMALDSPTEETECEETSAEEGEAAVTSEEKEAGVDSETEDVVESQPEEEVAAPPLSEESDMAQEENDGQWQQEEDEADEEEERDHNVQHEERRAHRSVGALVVPVAEDEDTEPDMRTPPFVREKMTFDLPYPTAPTILKPQASTSTEDQPPAKPKRARKRRSGAAARRDVGVPKSYLMSTFRHFAKTRVSADVYPVLRDAMEKFLDRMAEDLETFALHAGRKTIEVEDAILLLKRQGHVNDKVPVEVLIEKYLRMEQRKLLIPIATRGNVVVPKMRK
ncbi:centromere protein T [Hippocampus zosterae]|uniref:centromere protein T n=1 Tax=Hippocampus zosterae TaxID=109293 RepID=UPI00223E4303|nr:centromere protein T [Hippocampus zosterae]